MEFNPITPEVLDEIITITGDKRTLFQKDDLARFSHDETEDLHFYPEVVTLPETAEEVSALVKICSKNLIPITPRGAGTGLSGAALPIYGGLVICMERMNRLIKIDERNLQAHIQPGVITEELINAAAELNLFYPVDPASKGS